MTIRALSNFGLLGKNVAKGAVIDVDPADFGGTYPDFLKGGFFEEGYIGPLKDEEGNQIVEDGKPATGFIPGPAPKADTSAKGKQAPATEEPGA